MINKKKQKQTIAGNYFKVILLFDHFLPLLKCPRCTGLKCTRTLHCYSCSGFCTSCNTRVAATVLQFELPDVEFEQAAVLFHLILPNGPHRQ